MERPPEIGVDERRMHVRAYNYWVSLLDGRPYPSIGDVDPHTIEDFGPQQRAARFLATIGRIPRSPFSAARCATNARSTATIRHISEVPARSLLSRLTDHYLQIIANRAPIGFEAEFVGQRGHNTLYRGILMPLSSNGEFDRLHLRRDQLEGAGRQRDRRMRSRARSTACSPPRRAFADCPVWADGPNRPIEGGRETAPLSRSACWPDDGDPAPSRRWPTTPASPTGWASRANAPSRPSPPSSAAAPPSIARSARPMISRSPPTPTPEDYAELLDDAGLKVQARAPMTPVAKLVFGAGYDKTPADRVRRRLVLGEAREACRRARSPQRSRASTAASRAMVAAERRARRPAAAARPRPRRSGTGCAPRPPSPMSKSRLPESEDEFVLLVARREGRGRLAIVAPVTDPQADRPGDPQERRLKTCVARWSG